MDYVDKHYGSTNGGEKIKIYGQGFGKDKDAVEVLAGGMPCKIKKVSDDEIVCKTDKAKDNLPTINGVSHPGARGLKRTVVDPANESWGVGKTQFQRGDYPVISESLVTSFEVFDDLTKAGNKLSGYFKPPATGNYRFTVSCDDHCYLDFDSSPWIEGVEPTWTEIAYRIGASGWRQNQFENDPDTLDKLKVKSDWFFLLEGEFYPIRAWHIEGSGSDHVSVGMEFEESDSSASVHASKQIQKFEILQDNVAEQWQVSVYFPDQGCYKLTFAIMGDPPTVWASQCISSSASANTFRDSVKSFFWDNYRSAITVTRDEVLSGSTVIRYDYTVSLSKSIIGQSFDMIIGAKVTTMSQIAAMPPSVLSTPPISGKYKIQCTD